MGLDFLSRQTGICELHLRSGTALLLYFIRKHTKADRGKRRYSHHRGYAEETTAIHSKPDFRGIGNFHTVHGVDQPCECCVFLPKSPLAGVWMLIRVKPPYHGSPVAMSWKFCCELRVDNCSVYAEEVFHSGWTHWQWPDGTENTLVGQMTDYGGTVWRRTISENSPGQISGDSLCAPPFRGHHFEKRGRDCGG